MFVSNNICIIVIIDSYQNDKQSGIVEKCSSSGLEYKFLE